MKISNEKKKQILAEKDLLSLKQLSQKYDLSLDEIKRIIKAPKINNPKWFYFILVLLPFIFIVLLEIALRLMDYGYNNEQWVDAGEGKYIINPNIGRRYFTSGDFNPNTIEDVFDQKKKSNAFRVFVLGGSSAQGYPFNPMGSFSRYLRKRLELTYPKTKIEVVNLGMTAVNSFTILDLLSGVLEQKPDLILIYAGHNEYYGALGVGSVQTFGTSRSIIRLVLYLNNFKITQLVRNSVHWFSSYLQSESEVKESSGTLMSRMAKNKSIVLDSEVYYAGLQQFKDNLSDILELINKSGVPVIIGKLVSNLKDQKPFISVNTPGYMLADQLYVEAQKEFIKNNYCIADSLFRIAKELDALRFRAPEKINHIIEELGEKFNVLDVQIDSLFQNISPGGITGDNLIVDHLHPNVKGYQLIGKAFFNGMQKQGFVPKTEEAKISFDKQDSLTIANFIFTKLDTIIGNYYVKLLKSDWPYAKKRIAISNFRENDFQNLFMPNNFIDSLAMIRIESKVTWVEAHLIAATYYLRRDDLKQYLNHMNVLMYQYPFLKDLDFTIRYFYEQNKIKLADYTPKRNGLLALLVNNYENAIKHLKKANESDPIDTTVLYNLSIAYTKQKDYKSAFEMINKCLSIKPNYKEAIKLKEEILNQL